MNDKTIINKAFRKLRKMGYFARQSFWCCQTCVWGAVPEGSDKVVFYHTQDAESIKTGNIKGGLYLAWSGNGHEISEVFTKLGFKVEWNGTRCQRICIHSQSNG